MTKYYKFNVKKLVRDNITSILAAQGVQAFNKTLNDQEYKIALNNKLFEEAEEVLSAESKEELCQELGDVIEVIKAIGKVNNISFEDILKAAKEKHLLRGGFENKIYNDSILIPENSPALSYYKARPKQYPEIN